MKQSMKFILPVVILLAGFLLMKLFLSMKTDAPPREQSMRTKLVRADVVKPQTINARITSYGTVRSSQPVVLISEVSGTVFDGNLPFKPATKFKTGDLIVKIDNRQAVYNLNSTKSDFMSALALLLPEIKLDFPDIYDVWQNYFNSIDFESSIADLPETDNSRIKLFLSRFNIYKLYYQIKDLELRLEKYYFYAPFDGSVVSADLQHGSSARVGATLGQIINLEQLEVELQLPVDDYNWINDSQTVRLSSSGLHGEWFGKIIRIGNNINARTQTIPCYIRIESGPTENLINGILLKAELYGSVIENAVAVPREAVYSGNSVYVIKAGKLELRTIKIAREEPDAIIVDDGLEAGDTLVVEVMQGISTGMRAVPRFDPKESENTK